MAKTKRAPRSEAASASPNHPKLPRLPKNATIQKRPLLHLPIASPLAGSSVPKVIYISSKTPFIVIVKRVQKYLSESDKRDIGATDLLRSGSRGEKLRRLGKEMENRVRNENDNRSRNGTGSTNVNGERREEVMVRGTGKAIEKALQVGLWFQNQDGYEVRLRTGSVGAIDDISLPEKGSNRTGDMLEGIRRDKEQGVDGIEEKVGGRVEEAEKTEKQDGRWEGREIFTGPEMDAEVSDTRLRRTSTLEICISLIGLS